MSQPKELTPVEKLRLLNEKFGLEFENIFYKEKPVPRKKWASAIKWMNDSQGIQSYITIEV